VPDAITRPDGTKSHSRANSLTAGRKVVTNDDGAVAKTWIKVETFGERK
jgi:hypothetical protein